jgi:PAS domain S-box-containing protein
MPLPNLPNLLIVDDNKENLNFLRSIMRELQVNVIQALSGQEALDKIQGIDLALAIIDVQMPEMDGYELAIKINQERSDAKVPIIFLTASYFNDMAMLSGYNSGAVDYIFKPVTAHILLSKINVFLDLFVQKQVVIQNIAERIQAEGNLKQLNKELEARVMDRTAGLVKSNAVIQQLQQNYEAFFNAIDDLIFVLDEKGNIIQINNTVISRLGYKSQELIGNSIFMVHPSECHDEDGRIACKILSGKKKTCSVPLITKSGIQIPVETKTSSGIWNGEPVIFVVTKDISKIKLSEEKFSKVFHLNPSACGLSKLDDNKFLEVNEAFCTLFGFDKAEVIGKTVWDLDIMTHEVRNAILSKADSNGSIKNIEADLKAKNGEIKHVILSAENIHVQDKNYRFTVVHDITKRKRTEKALKKSEAMLNKAQQIAHIGSWELNEKTQELQWSDETFRMFGYPPYSVHPTMELFMQCIHPENMPAVLESIAVARNTQKPYSVDHQIIRPDGQVRFVHEQAEITYDVAGQPVKWFGTVQDITEKKQIQENIVKAIILTEEKDRAYFSKELHDGLGPLLSTIKLYLQWSERAKTKTSRAEIIQKAEEIVEEALTTAKEISNKLSPHLLLNYGLNAAILNFVSNLEESSGIRIDFKSDVNRRLTDEMEASLYRALIECLNNTIKHARANNICILLNDADNQITLNYTDDGIGFNLDETLLMKKGFGLFNMKNRIQTIGGKITLNSKPGHGVDYEIIVNLKPDFTRIN